MDPKAYSIHYTFISRFLTVMDKDKSLDDLPQFILGLNLMKQRVMNLRGVPKK